MLLHCSQLTDSVQHSECNGTLALRSTVVRLPRDDDGDRSVTRTDDQDASKVADVQVRVAGVDRADGIEDRPANNPTDIDSRRI